MNMKKNPFDRVMETLLSTERSLKVLAENSGYSILPFYRGANLTNLNLDGQDLTGLNFDNADLRFSNLTNTTYDEGAFNNSVLPDESGIRIDEFDCYMEDIVEEYTSSLYIFIKFRSDFLDKEITRLGLSYQEFSERCNLSTSTVRKARRSEVISIESAISICKNILDNKSKLPSSQPCISVIYLANNRRFSIVSRKSLIIVSRCKSMVDNFRKSSLGYRMDGQWRDSPEWVLALFQSYFGDAPRLPEFEQSSILYLANLIENAVAAEHQHDLFASD
jgi:hypothetical protein